MIDEAKADNGTEALPTESGRASAADPLKIAAAFQREIFRTQDSRLSQLDGLGGIVVAAAIAVATFTGSLVKNGNVSISGLITTVCRHGGDCALCKAGPASGKRRTGRGHELQRKRGRESRRRVPGESEKPSARRYHRSGQARVQRLVCPF
jgi:hypothetical protein